MPLSPLYAVPRQTGELSKKKGGLTNVWFSRMYSVMTFIASLALAGLVRTS